VADSPKPLHRSKAFHLALGLAVTVACLAWAFYAMGAKDDPWHVLRQIGSAFADAHYWTLLPYWLLLFIFYWLKAWRWRLLLAPLGDFRPTRDLLPPILVGFGFNNLLPAHLGEFVRMYVFARDQRLPMTPVLSSIVLERVCDMVTILALLCGGLLFVPATSETVRGIAWGATLLVLVLVLGTVLYIARTREFVRFIEGCMNVLPVLPRASRRRIAELLEVGAAGMLALKNGRLRTGILVLSVLQWVLNAGLFALSLAAFDIRVSVPITLLLMGAVAFAVLVPSSPGYFGVIQVCFVAVLGLFVQDAERVFAASIYYHMAQWIPVTLLGLYFFNRSGLRVSDVESRKESVVHPQVSEPAG
jgi:uncharacterized protein (TIRG00374 family)